MTSPDALLAHIPSLRRYARALTGDAWAADDLVQDTLERACEKWRLWHAGTDLRAWLFSVMHNLFASQARRAPPRGAVELSEVDDQLAAPGGDQDAQRRIDLQRCLLQLPEDQRAVLLLVGLEDLSYDEAARVLGVPSGTVMSRLSRARARLRVLMDGAGTSGPAAPSAPASPPPGRPSLRRLK